MRCKWICVDLDGTLCKGVCWTTKQVLAAKPRKKIIKKINALYRENFIVIYTARRDHLISASLRWLRRNGVLFHAFSNNKIPAEGYYVDDKAIRPEEL